MDVARVLKRYLLKEVEETSDHETLGDNVEILRYGGSDSTRRCAGKLIALKSKHEQNFETTNSGIITRCKEQCDVMNKVSHINIAKFLGVYYQTEKVPIPILRVLTEYLPTNLTNCIDQYRQQRHDVLPNETSYSILYDVAKGLSYLHSQGPPIIHRNLHSSNVLLNENMTAKITDLGVAKILTHLKYPTRKPGREDCMPPEAMVKDPTYNASIDEFAYGIVVIHVLCGNWPTPKHPPVTPDYQQGNTQLKVINEVERRQDYLDDISDDNIPLKQLAIECLDNNPKQRPDAGVIVRRLSEMVDKSPDSADQRGEVYKVVLTQGKEANKF
jgi:serine/threonine protein kinase